MHDVHESTTHWIESSAEPGRATRPHGISAADPSSAVTTRRSLLRSLFGLPFALLAPRALAEGGLEQFYKFNIKPEIFLEEVFGGEVPVAQCSGLCTSATLLLGQRSGGVALRLPLGARHHF